MSRLPILTGEFVVGSDPELRFTPAGKAVCSVSLIATESKKTDTGWEDGDSTPWITATLWAQAAETTAEHVRKGMRVLVTGALFARKYEKRDGEAGQSIELKWVTLAPIPKADVQRTSQGSGYSDDPWTTPQAGGPTQHHTPDPWATPASDEPPF